MLSNQYISMSSLNFDVLFDLEIERGSFHDLGCTSVPNLMFIKQRVLKIWSSQCMIMSSLTLESVGVINFFRMYHSVIGT
jgi:hypothetical protein